jgi:Ni/Fe-hydrogenase subunit HybB-like protein
MLYVFYLQNTEGLIVTGMTSQIHDGLYLANLVFLVGVAAGAVTIVFPAYVYHHEGMHKVTVLGEMLAISAVIMVMFFVFAHMGRPDRLWHMVPPWGIYSFSSMLGWDVLVLNGYLILNAVVGFWYLYSKYTGKPVNKKIFMPLVYVSIVWALSIHTVTAFLLATNPARPMWFHSMMPIRFIATAFAAGPALIIIAFLIIRKNTKFWIEDSAIQLLATIVTWCLGIAIFLTLSEIVVELYARTEHANGLYYLMFGLHGLTGAGALVLELGGADGGVVRAVADAEVRNDMKLLPIVCAMAFVGIWIEKGMGLIVPGFIPSPIGEVTEYYPTFVEWLMTLGIWAFGFFILTILLKGAIGILLGDIRFGAPPRLPRRRRRCNEVITMKRSSPFPPRRWPCSAPCWLRRRAGQAPSRRRCCGPLPAAAAARPPR